MKKSKFHNRSMPDGKPYVIAEVGVIFSFRGSVNKSFEVTEVRGSRPFSGEQDLFKLWEETKELPVVLVR